MKKPRPLTVKGPVKLIFVSGFLGSGKTTALSVLARQLKKRGLRIGIITNDQSGNLADTVILGQMLKEMDVPIEEVVDGCFCCKFDKLMDQIDKILINDLDILLGEPVGSCTDFVASVARPMMVHYGDHFRFAPISAIVDPGRMTELLLKETASTFPEEVAYLFRKQLEEAELIVLNKIDLFTEIEIARLTAFLYKEFPDKQIIAVSAKYDINIEKWLAVLLSDRSGARSVLRQIDYDRYARAEAVLGWLNAAVKISSAEPIDSERLLTRITMTLRNEFRVKNAGIGHLKCSLTGNGKSMWVNLTHLSAEPILSAEKIGHPTVCTLLVNARVKIEPEALEIITRRSLHNLAENLKIKLDIQELRCFSPSYPAPPYRMRNPGGEKNEVDDQ
ncbi:MAG: hypothetical protein C4519_02970 [Desulfobacteraceae bacterium]|nr:MAG: hypothetical protein C4519_02970 [Desulfobacteraceae bacterium]